MAMKKCSLCNMPADENHPSTYHEVTSWVSGPKLDGPKLREHTGRIAHEYCIELAISGQAPDQPKLEL